MPTLLSWGATMFEYLMPLLVMRRYPDTLLDETCRMAVRRQIQYGKQRGVPWGISESRVQRRRPPRHLSVPGVWRARSRPAARSRRRSGDRSVRDRAGDDDRAGRGHQEPATAARRRRWTGRSATTTPWTITSRGGDPTESQATTTHAMSRRHDRANGDGPPSGHDAGVDRQHAARVADGRALPRRSPDQGDRAPAAGARARGTCR